MVKPPDASAAISRAARDAATAAAAGDRHIPELRVRVRAGAGEAEIAAAARLAIGSAIGERR